MNKIHINSTTDMLFKYSKNNNNNHHHTTNLIWIFCLTSQDDFLITYLMINYSDAALDCDPGVKFKGVISCSCSKEL